MIPDCAGHLLSPLHNVSHPLFSQLLHQTVLVARAVALQVQLVLGKVMEQHLVLVPDQLAADVALVLADEGAELPPDPPVALLHLSLATQPVLPRQVVLKPGLGASGVITQPEESHGQHQ